VIVCQLSVFLLIVSLNTVLLVYVLGTNSFQLSTNETGTMLGGDRIGEGREGKERREGKGRERKKSQTNKQS
jgi:hypothetical protein